MLLVIKLYTLYSSPPALVSANKQNSQSHPLVAATDCADFMISKRLFEAELTLPDEYYSPRSILLAQLLQAASAGSNYFWVPVKEIQ